MHLPPIAEPKSENSQDEKAENEPMAHNHEPSSLFPYGDR